MSGPPSRGPLSNYVREGPERGPYEFPGDAFRRRSLPVIRRAVAYVKSLILEWLVEIPGGRIEGGVGGG